MTRNPRRQHIAVGYYFVQFPVPIGHRYVLPNSVSQWLQMQVRTFVPSTHHQILQRRPFFSNQENVESHTQFINPHTSLYHSTFSWCFTLALFSTRLTPINSSSLSYRIGLGDLNQDFQPHYVATRKLSVCTTPILLSRAQYCLQESILCAPNDSYKWLSGNQSFTCSLAPIWKGLIFKFPWRPRFMLPHLMTLPTGTPDSAFHIYSTFTMQNRTYTGLIFCQSSSPPQNSLLATQVLLARKHFDHAIPPSRRAHAGLVIWFFH